MQIHNVETNAGTAIWAAPFKIPSRSDPPSCRTRSIFSIVTVASSTRMPTAKANPPSVMMLMVSPNRLITIIDVRTDKGIETAIISVLRQLPRNKRIIRPVSPAAITPSRITPLTALRTKMLWSDSGVIFKDGGTIVATRGSKFFTPLTTLSVDALPAFRTLMSTPRRPSCRTTLVCNANPSLTVATSLR